MNKVLSLLKIFKPTRTFSLLETCLFLWIVTISLFFSLLTPPFQSPDEYVHFDKTSAISNGLFLCDENSIDQGRRVKFDQLIESVNRYKLPFNYGSKFYYKEYFQPLFSSPDGERATQIAQSACTLPTMGYLPQAIGLKAANTLHLNAVFAFYTGRLFALAVFLITLYLVVNHSRKEFGLVFLVTSSIPMFLHQVGSYSYDSFNFSVGFVLFFLLFKLISSKTLNVITLISYFVILFLFYLTKPNAYVLFFLTPIFFIRNVIKQLEKKHLIILAIGVIFITLSLLIYKSRPWVSSITSSRADSVIEKEMSKQELQALIVKDNPLMLVNIVYDTHNVFFWSYLQTFLGMFGWLDYGMGMSVYFIVFGLIIYVASIFKLPFKEKRPLLMVVLSLLIISGTYIIVVIGMFFSHTWLCCEIGGSISYGVQGRYFLLILPIFFLMIGYIKQSKINKVVFISIIFLFMGFKITDALYNRYYNYSSVINEVPQFPSLLADEQKKQLISKTSFKFDAESNRKLAGVTLGPLESGAPPRMPYKYTVFQAECDDNAHIISSGVIANKHYAGNQINITFSKPIGPFEDDKHFCLTLEPYVTRPDTLKSLPLITVGLEQNSTPSAKAYYVAQ